MMDLGQILSLLTGGYEIFWNNKYYEYIFKTSKKIFFFPKRF